MQDASTRAATLQRAAELSTAESCIEKHGKIRLLFIMRDFGDIEVARA